jgi:hypothetical protein
MEEEVLDHLSNHWNKPVFDFIQDYSAHSDVGEALFKVAEPLGDVQWYSPDLFRCRYVVFSTRAIIFSLAIDLRTVAFRLNAPFNQQALAAGGSVIPELGDEWVSFALWAVLPESDLSFWTQKAYVYARETRAI